MPELFVGRDSYKRWRGESFDALAEAAQRGAEFDAMVDDVQQSVNDGQDQVFDPSVRYYGPQSRGVGADNGTASSAPDFGQEPGPSAGGMPWWRPPTPPPDVPTLRLPTAQDVSRPFKMERPGRMPDFGQEPSPSVGGMPLWTPQEPSPSLPRVQGPPDQPRQVFQDLNSGNALTVGQRLELAGAAANAPQQILFGAAHGAMTDVGPTEGIIGTGRTEVTGDQLLDDAGVPKGTGRTVGGKVIDYTIDPANFMPIGLGGKVNKTRTLLQTAIATGAKEEVVNTLRAQLLREMAERTVAEGVGSGVVGGLGSAVGENVAPAFGVPPELGNAIGGLAGGAAGGSHVADLIDGKSSMRPLAASLDVLDPQNRAFLREVAPDVAAHLETTRQPKTASVRETVEDLPTVATNTPEVPRGPAPAVPTAPDGIAPENADFLREVAPEFAPPPRPTQAALPEPPQRAALPEGRAPEVPEPPTGAAGAVVPDAVPDSHFPESLPKITNAISGTAGGSIADVTNPATNMASRLPAGWTEAAVGLGAGVAENARIDSENPDMSLEDRMARIGLAALAGGVTANRLRSGGQVGGSIFNFGGRRTSPVSADPRLRNVENMFNNPPKPPSSTVAPTARVTALADWVTKRMFDSNIGAIRIEQAAARILGVKELSPEQSMVLQSLMNPNRAADILVQNTVQQAVRSVGDDIAKLETYITLKGNPEVAKAVGNPNRVFSGGLTAADSKPLLDKLETELGPERWQRIEDAAKKINQFNDYVLQSAVYSGRITEDTAAALRQKYPNWAKTQILDYLDDPTRIPHGQKLGLSDNGLREYTVDGTDAARESPINASLRSGYASLNRDRQNIAFRAFVTMRDDIENTAGKSVADTFARRVSSNYTARQGEQVVHGFLDGTRVNYAVAGDVAAAIKKEPTQVVPVLNVLTTLFKHAVTSRNPGFLAANSVNDAMTYTLRTMSREGGNPLNAPGIVGDLFVAYVDAFKGLLSGTFEGKATQRYFESGGGYGGYFNASRSGTEQRVRDLSRRSPFEIRNASDVARIVKDILLLKPVESIGERIELAPRVAAFKRAERQGQAVERAVRAGQTVTIDFAQAGTVAKTLNQIIPFFNVGLQGMATPLRAVRENPRGALLTAATALAAPVVAAEIWNNADPQRKADYDEVPDWEKERGIIVMAPWNAPRDARGERRADYMLIPLREYAPFAIAMREGVRRVMNEKPTEWQKLTGQIVKAASPFQIDSGVDAATILNPAFLRTATELGFNRDSYRNQPIATIRNDERASTLGQTAGPALGVRPSQVDFALNSGGGGYGKLLTAGSDMLAGREKPGTVQTSERVQDVPVAGAFVNRFLRSNRAGMTGVLQNKGLSETQADQVLQTLGDASLVRERSLPQMDTVARGVAEGKVSGEQFRTAWADMRTKVRNYVDANGQLLDPAVRTMLADGISIDDRRAQKLLRGMEWDERDRKVMEYQNLAPQAVDERGLFDPKRYATARRAFFASLSPEDAAYVRQHRTDYITDKGMNGTSLADTYPVLAQTLRETEQAADMMSVFMDTPKYRTISVGDGENADALIGKLDDLVQEVPGLARLDRKKRLMWFAARMSAAGTPIDGATLFAAQKVIRYGDKLTNPARDLMRRRPEWALVRKYYGDLVGTEIAALRPPPAAAPAEDDADE